MTLLTTGSVKLSVVKVLRFDCHTRPSHYRLHCIGNRIGVPVPRKIVLCLRFYAFVNMWSNESHAASVLNFRPTWIAKYVNSIRGSMSFLPRTCKGCSVYKHMKTCSSFPQEIVVSVLDHEKRNGYLQIHEAFSIQKEKR